MYTIGTGQSGDLLTATLERVSRSFFLTLRVLPRDLRCPVGLAYLLARAADTIADSPLISRSERLAYLDRFRAAIGGGDPGALTTIARALSGSSDRPAERQLLQRLEEAFALLRGLDAGDRALVTRLILTLTQGMILDLDTFPGEDEGRLVALETRADLDRYTYYVAGCVGEFWTDIHMAHRPALAGWHRETMVRLGVRFGKGLQMTNVLRDLPRDLRIGRCYLPRADLGALGLRPADLLDRAAIVRLRPLLRDLLAVTMGHYRAGWQYVLAIPRREVRLRLACAWPLLIGLETLALVAQASNLLDPGVTLKVRRLAVYALMLCSLATIGSNGGLDRCYQFLRRRVPVEG
jgi:farnesyl-diphosphate farnesyltransferase